MSLAAGSRLAAYEIVGSLGAGGMGEVYRAHDPRLGRDVALKVLPADMAADPARLERFTREARAIAALNHPHIVTIYSTEEADGIRFLTMELVDGQALDTLIPPQGLTLTRFLEIALPLADALTAAHQKQITHRDLKPANVMVAADGRVKVLDFGLARVGGGALPSHQTIEATRPVLTSEGTIVGTIPYMSPEQIDGKTLDHRTDLFSLGVMFHEMLVGSRPFAGDSSPQLMSSILRDTPASASELKPEVPEALSRLIHRCLEKRPDDRMQTARDVYNELRLVQKQFESGPRRRPDSGTGPAMTADSLWIAVLPFTTRGADPDAVALAEGLTEDITAGLARFPTLSVVAAQSALSFKASPLDVRQIAERLNASYVAGGSVRRSSAGTRVTAHLIDARSGAQLWTETYDHAADNDLFTVQDGIADRVVATVADVYGVLFRSMSQGLKERPLDTLSAGEVLIRYWSYERQPAVAEHALLRARLEQLVGNQPSLADAWAALGDLYYQEFAHGFNPLPDSLARAHRAVGRALDVDASHHHAWHVRAVTCFFDRDRDGFEHAAARALALNPRNTNTMAFLAFLFSQLGETDRACEMTRRAMALNPAFPGWYHFVFFDRHYMRGEFAEALAQARKINMAQNLWSPWAVAVCAGQLGRASDAKVALEALFALAPVFEQDDVLRDVIMRWRWNQPANVDLAMDGFRKAKALTGRGVPAPDPEAKQPARSPDSAAGLAADAFVVTVIPFAASAGGDAAELADGLTQGTAVGLSRFSYLRVVTRNVAAESVATGYALHGSVRVAGGVIRVVAQLREGTTGQSLWAETYDRKIGERSIFELQDELIEKIVATIADVNGALIRAMAAIVRHKSADALTPYEAVLRALAYIALMSPEEHTSVLQALEAAVERAPHYADAWAALAFIYSEEYAQAFAIRPQALERVAAAARRALELDSSNQLAYFAQSRSAFFRRDMSAFRAAADRLITLNPLATHVLSFIGTATAYSGDWEAGLAYCARAMALNPNHPGIYHMPSVVDRYRRRDYPGALAILDRVNMPGFLPAMLVRAVVHAQLGRLDDAVALWREVEARVPGYVDRANEGLTKWFQPDVVAHIEEGIEIIRRHVARQHSLASSPGLATGPSIAVLPFDDLSPGKDQDWFCDGMSEEILNALAQLPGLRVAARASAFAFRNRGDDLPAIASKLGVASVLQGSVRRSGDRIRVTVQLVDAGNGFQLWSDRYDRELKDIFDVQDEIARTIAARLKVSLSLDAGDRLVSRVTPSLEAYELLLKGRTFVTRRGRAIFEALPCFERAVALDPGLAEAHALLGDSYRLLGLYGMAPATEVMPKARASIDRALSIDPANVEALATRANIAAVYEWDVRAAMVHAERALAADPRHVRTLGERAAVLTVLEAPPPDIVASTLESVRRARAIDPLNAWAAAIEAYCHAVTGHQAEAVPMAHHAVTLDAENFAAQWILVWTLSAAGRVDEALAAAGPALAMSGRNARVLAEVAAIHGMRGDRAAAEAIFQELRARAETGYVPYAEQCAVAASAGREDDVRTLLEQAIESREPSLAFWRLPAWAPFRADPVRLARLRATGIMSLRSNDLPR